jgi:hypothetical protein
MVALGLTGAVSFGLYQLSYAVQGLEDDLEDFNRVVIQERENIAVLHAEWSYLTRPEALQAGARRHLELAPIEARQIVSLGELPSKQARLKTDDAPNWRDGAAPRPRAKPSAPPPVHSTRAPARVAAFEAPQ